MAGQFWFLVKGIPDLTDLALVIQVVLDFSLSFLLIFESKSIILKERYFCNLVLSPCTIFS